MKWEQCKGQRIHKRFNSIAVRRNDKFLWWVTPQKVWVEDYMKVKNYDTAANCCSIHSLKAIRKHIKKYCQKGDEILCCHRYIGYNLKITKK